MFKLRLRDGSGQDDTASRAGNQALSTPRLAKPTPVLGLVCDFPCDTHANVIVTHAKHLARALSPSSIPLLFSTYPELAITETNCRV